MSKRSGLPSQNACRCPFQVTGYSCDRLRQERCSDTMATRVFLPLQGTGSLMPEEEITPDLQKIYLKPSPPPPPSRRHAFIRVDFPTLPVSALKGLSCPWAAEMFRIHLLDELSSLVSNTPRELLLECSPMAYIFQENNAP